MAVVGWITLDGGRELQRLLKDLDRKQRRKITASALRAGAKVILKEARLRAPVRTGLLKKEMKVRAAKKRKGEDVAIRVMTSEGDFAGNSFYGSILHAGYMKAPAVRLRDGRFISVFPKGRAKRPRAGHNPLSRDTAALKGYTYQHPRPFMADAYKAKAKEAVDVVRRTMINGILDATKSK